MSSAPTADEIARDATWLVQALDPAADKVRLVRMTRESYRAASFLDDRMFQQAQVAHVVDWNAVIGAANGRRDARWIFHIGHVGSTLIARLLGEIQGVLSLREPRILRDITAVPDDRRRSCTTELQALVSRTFAAEEAALVKATSFVSEIADELIPSGGRALFMYATPRAYIESILAGENSRKEMGMLADARDQRMADRVERLDQARSSEAHLAAAAWACEMTSLEAAAEAMPDRHIEWADFDIMLDSIAAALGEVAEFFCFPTTPERISEIVQGPLMLRYSKAPEYDYSPALRRELLDEARNEHGRTIESALAMLKRASENAPLLERALRRADQDI